jgi:hypothetical protein
VKARLLTSTPSNARLMPVAQLHNVVNREHILCSAPSMLHYQPVVEVRGMVDSHSHPAQYLHGCVLRICNKALQLQERNKVILHWKSELR